MHNATLETCYLHSKQCKAATKLPIFWHYAVDCLAYIDYFYQ